MTEQEAINVHDLLLTALVALITLKNILAQPNYSDVSRQLVDDKSIQNIYYSIEDVFTGNHPYWTENSSDEDFTDEYESRRIYYEEHPEWHMLTWNEKIAQLDKLKAAHD